jgi:hypothetical protein
MHAAPTGSRRPRTSKPPGNEAEHPAESYWVGFTVGSIVYTVEVHGNLGSVSEEQAQSIASAYYERLAGE